MKLTSALGLTLVLLLVLSLIIPEVIILNKITHIVTITILTHDNIIKGGVEVNPTSQRSSRKSWKGRRRQRHQVFYDHDYFNHDYHSDDFDTNLWMSGQSSSVQRRVEGGERSPRNLGGGETERGEVGAFSYLRNHL